MSWSLPGDRYAWRQHPKGLLCKNNSVLAKNTEVSLCYCQYYEPGLHVHFFVLTSLHQGQSSNASVPSAALVLGHYMCFNILGWTEVLSVTHSSQKFDEEDTGRVYVLVNQEINQVINNQNVQSCPFVGTTRIIYHCLWTMCPFVWLPRRHQGGNHLTLLFCSDQYWYIFSFTLKQMFSFFFFSFFLFFFHLITKKWMTRFPNT